MNPEKLYARLISGFYYTLIVFLICFVSVPYTASSKESLSTTSTKQDISFIFDMGGVCLTTNKFTVASNIGYAPILKRIFWHFQSFSSIQQLLYSVLDQSFLAYGREAELVPLAYDPHGKELPYYMRLWLSGEIESQTIKQEVINWITVQQSSFANTTEKMIIQSLVHAIFTPELFIEAQHITKEAMQLVSLLKNAGYHLFILSNWDRESFPLLEKKYPEFFAQFDGIIVSGFEGYLKPEIKLYTILLERYQLTPSHCIFIDDQAENIVAAQKQDIVGVLCNNFSAVSYGIVHNFIA